MRERSRVAILASGRGSNMAALIYAARAADCAYEVVLATGDRPNAPALGLAEAEGVPVARLPHPTAKDKSQFFEALKRTLDEANVDNAADQLEANVDNSADQMTANADNASDAMKSAADNKSDAMKNAADNKADAMTNSH